MAALSFAFKPETFAQRAGSDLPPDVQADILRQTIVAAAKRSDFAAVVKAIEQYRALPVELPPALALVEARAASQLGDSGRAFDSLKDFLKVAPRDSAQYKEALGLYPSYEEAATSKRTTALVNRAVELNASGNRLGAYDTLTEYFKIATPDDSKYAQAKSLFSELQSSSDVTTRHAILEKEAECKKLDATHDEQEAMVDDITRQMSAINDRYQPQCTANSDPACFQKWHQEIQPLVSKQNPLINSSDASLIASRRCGDELYSLKQSKK